MMDNLNKVVCTSNTGDIVWGTAGISSTSYWTASSITDAVDLCLKSQEPPKPEVSEDVKTIMNSDGKRIKIKHYDKGFHTKTTDVMSDIKNVSIYNNRVVAIEFVDGTKEKAVLDPQDNFTLEQGISICIAKKLAGGSSIYNKLIDHAMDVMKKNEKAKVKAEAEEKRRKEKAKKIAEKKKKRKASQQEEQIEIIAEAIKRVK